MYDLKSVEIKMSVRCSKSANKKVESQGKVSEKSGNFDMDNEWQP